MKEKKCAIQSFKYLANLPKNTLSNLLGGYSISISLKKIKLEPLKLIMGRIKEKIRSELELILQRISSVKL